MNTKGRRLFLVCISVLLCVSFLTSCGKETPDAPIKDKPAAAPTADASAAAATPTPAAEATATPTPEPTPVPATVEITYEGQPVTALSFMTSTVVALKATVSDGSTGGTWTSSDASVASVDENGVVSCWKTGNPRITYTCGNASNYVSLTITEASVKILFGGVEKNDISLSSVWGYEIQLSSQVSPEGAAVTWTSDDPTIATVSETGLVTAKRSGNTTINCKCGTSKASCVIRVLGVPPIQQQEIAQATPDPTDTSPRIIITYAGAANTDFTIAVGTSVDMNYTLRNMDENSTVLWSIKDTNIATVNGDGVVVAVSPGVTTLSAISGDVKCDCTVRVSKNT